MRGKDKQGNKRTAVEGITPAYAGKRDCAEIYWLCEKDHPRVCGEKNVLAHGLLPLLGSPPRMRGKVHVQNAAQNVIGITPAYAGKSRRGIFLIAGARDHPRVCGEKVDGGRNRSRQMGSPPRMRGKD